MLGFSSLNHKTKEITLIHELVHLVDRKNIDGLDSQGRWLASHTSALQPNIFIALI